jgi:hypothetical protein
MPYGEIFERPKEVDKFPDSDIGASLAGGTPDVSSV